MAELIVVSVAPNHPSGHRNRAGFRFSSVPSVAEVNAEQRKTIKEDRYLTIHRRLSLAWFKAFNVDRTEDNEKKFAETDPEGWASTANLALLVDGQVPDTTDKVRTQPGATGGGPEGAARPLVNGASSREDCAAALVTLGLEPGKDFDPEAGRNVLLAIYREKAGIKPDDAK